MSEYKSTICSQMEPMNRRIPHRLSETTSFEFSTSLAAGHVLAKKTLLRVSLLGEIRLTVTQTHPPVTSARDGMLEEDSRARSLSCAGSLPPLRVEAYPCAFFCKSWQHFLSRSSIFRAR